MPNSYSTDQEYHGGALVGIPFNWESQPETPKISFQERNNTLPPITPPPSYFYKTCTSRKPNKMLSKGRASSLSLSSSFSSSSSFSLAGSPLPWRMTYLSRLWKFCGRSGGSGISRQLEFEEEDAEVESPISTLCFKFSREVNARSRGRYASSTIKMLLKDV